MRLTARLVVLLGLVAAPAVAQSLFSFDLEEGQEVPPTGSRATGRCIARLDAVESALVVTCLHDVVGATMAHIHHAVPGVNGPIVFPFPSAASPIDGVWQLTPADVAALEAGALYVNVHSGAFPDGEIRGQITAPASEAYSFPLEEGQEVPPTGSGAVGSCDGVLDDAEALFSIVCHHGVTAPSAAHIHNAEPGVIGPVVFAFTDVDSPMFDVWAPSPEHVVELRAGRLYVNVHSASFPDGEIRGQIRPAVPVVFADDLETGGTERWTTTVE